MSKTKNRLKMPAGFADMNAESMEYEGSGGLNWKEITGIAIAAVGLVIGIVGITMLATASEVQSSKYYLDGDGTWANSSESGSWYERASQVPRELSRCGKVGACIGVTGAMMLLGSGIAFGTGVLEKS